MMKALLKAIMLTAAMLAFGLPQASADTLLGTTGSGNANSPFSVLVQIDQDTGKLIRTIGPVGHKVNGLAFDRATQTLYATTSVKSPFHGLITINTTTGAGTPVNAGLVNFGLGGSISPIMAITIDSKGQMVGWYQECLAGPCAPGTTDTFVTIDKATGIATEFNNTGIDAARLGLSFNSIDQLWLFDSPVAAGVDGTLVQLIWLIDPATGKPVLNGFVSPPKAAFLGDFSPSKNHYYGINKDPTGTDPTAAELVVVNIKNGKVKTVGPTVNDLHTLTFVKPVK